MSQQQALQSRGRTWFQALVGNALLHHTSSASVLCADTILHHKRVRYLTIVPDPQNTFSRARHGELGLNEGWALAHCVNEALAVDNDADRRAIIAVVDVPSQAYGRREEAAGIHLACAAAADAYARARLAGHPIIALLVGHALSGAFLAHGYQANCILALDDPGVIVHAMGKEAAARVTRRTPAELNRLAESILPMSYDIRAYAQLGIIHTLIKDINATSPDKEDILSVQNELAAAIVDAQEAPYTLSNRLTSVAARTHRAASVEVRVRMAAVWN